MASTIKILFCTFLFATTAFSTGINNGGLPLQVANEKKHGGVEETLQKLYQEGKVPKGLWLSMHKDEDLKKAIETGEPLPQEYMEALAGSFGQPGQEPQAPTSREKNMKNEKVRAPATTNLAFPVHRHKKYCVPKPEVNDQVLQANIDWACKNGVDCDPLVNMKEITCADQTLKTKAAYAMNYYYNAHARRDSVCDFNQTAILAPDNPSIGKCAFL